jgi:hypothetical protein
VDSTDPLGLDTLGACFSFNAQIGPIAGSAGECIVRTEYTGSDDIGFTLTDAGGVGFGEYAGGMLYWEFSNCGTLYCLGSWFGYFGWGFDEGVGLTVFYANVQYGIPRTYGADIGVMLGEGVQASAGASYTWVYKFTCAWWDWACKGAANWARWAWDVLTSPIIWLVNYLPSWLSWAKSAARWWIRNR